MEIHYLSMVAIGAGSLVFGILPMAFSFRIKRSYPFFLSLILCLGAGVLLATSLVHMLTEVQEKLKPYAQLYFCVGLFCLYIFDEISHYCLGVKNLEIHSADDGSIKRSSYGAIEHGENTPFLEPTQSKVFTENNFSYINSHSRNHRESLQSLIGNSSQNEDNVPNEVMSHLADREQQLPNTATKTGLLISLLVHSILEGVSIGIQTKTSEILLILGAVLFHKTVLSFCLGLELHYNGFSKFHLIFALFLFSLGSPCGILLGMSFTSLESGIFSMDAQLQALAAGSLLYVSLLEVLPRERLKWRTAKKGGGIIQLLFLLIGFSSITLFHFFYASKLYHSLPQQPIDQKSFCQCKKKLGHSVNREIIIISIMLSLTFYASQIDVQ